MTALIVIIIIILILMLWSGKAHLFHNVSSGMPQLSGETDQLKPDEEWDEDWIRYQGKVYDYNENILSFLCMGIDMDNVLGEEQQGRDSGQANAIFLLVLNPDTQKMSIIAIDRNTMTEVDMYDQDNHFLDTVQ